MMDGGIIPLKAMGGGILSLEDIAAAGKGETPAAEPAATDDIFIFGRHSSAETFANLAERGGLSGLPASVTGDGTGFQVNHFLVIEAFADKDVQDTYRLMKPDGFNVNRYSRRLPATIAAQQALAAGNSPYTASMHFKADGTHFDMNRFQKAEIRKIVADFNAGRITGAEGIARTDALADFLINTSINTDPNLVTTFWDNDDPRLKALLAPPVQEVIDDGVHGRLVDFFDVPGWSAALTEALANPAALHPLAQAARARVVERYDLAVCLPKWVGFVERHGPGAEGARP